MPKKTKAQANDPLPMPDEKVKWAKPAPPGMVNEDPDDDLEEEYIDDNTFTRHQHRAPEFVSEEEEEEEEDSEEERKKKKKKEKKEKKKKKKHHDDSDDEEEQGEDAGVLADLARAAEEKKRKEDEILRRAQEAEEAKAEGGERAAEIKRVVKGFDESNLGFPRKQLHMIISHWTFDIIIGIAIFMNGVTIAFETHINSGRPMTCNEDCICQLPNNGCELTPDWITFLDLVFFVVYILELTMRLVVFGPAVLASNWVKFDAILVSLSIFNKIMRAVVPNPDGALQVLTVFRMFRLLRLARAVRLMVQFQTLWQLVQGLMSSVMTLSWTFLLLSILIYVFAIFGMYLITVDLDLPLDHPYNVAANDNFRELPDACLMLLQFFSWDSISSVYRPLIQHKFHLFFYFMSVLLLLSIALMNLVTAIMVEGSLSQASADKDNQKVLLAAKQQKQMEQLKVMFREMDDDGSGELSMDEIDAAPDEVREQLVEIAGTDDINSLFEMLDYDGGGTVGTDEFCDGVMKANFSDKPLEISRLMKQCSDILQNSREAVTLLRGEEWTASANPTGADDDGDDDSNKAQKKKPAQKSDNPRITALEGRMNSMDRTIQDLEGDVKQLVQAMTKFVSTSSGARTAANGMKKAVAVAVLKGPARN
mmetsp:Transcript_34762/g.63255  ORF Transcript_34762/g.63255 Transcript_34762/m.63255 type:complete len:649 (+) Transcript_34762:31-1977(+)|eukprot:CAMPEP_0197626350 /NCGR_PEP_ID=MMETSP1338-20131121/5362_1 /TAXON_ID=43686 ORGANISM="Pelagodinium beii, Strain RCC1491" /NCGR_SAMPLE_ID=MMETSP1338 /ASSEMBLY_ACC=CAM_ASM_000754 /LENGTH=648 /DNA_ID=CAMNT_0043196889 /DNA_START=31 /DNA_END=1977 /DNA_ORIENTATION=+